MGWEQGGRLTFSFFPVWDLRCQQQQSFYSVNPRITVCPSTVESRSQVVIKKEKKNVTDQGWVPARKAAQESLQQSGFTEKIIDPQSFMFSKDPRWDYKIFMQISTDLKSPVDGIYWLLICTKHSARCCLDFIKYLLCLQIIKHYSSCCMRRKLSLRDRELDKDSASGVNEWQTQFSLAFKPVCKPISFLGTADGRQSMELDFCCCCCCC